VTICGGPPFADGLLDRLAEYSRVTLESMILMEA